MPSRLRLTLCVPIAILLAGCELVIGYEEAQPVVQSPYGQDGQSCLGGLTCNGGSCCDAPVIPAGSFEMGRGSTPHQASVAVFALDAYEVAVGRFRKFVETYDGTPPPAGAGRHPYVDDSGWKASWNARLPPSREKLQEALRCDASTSFATWTDEPAGGELRPINCVSWYLAFMFCAWDGGRLPTEAEWEYAATGGAEQNIFPWGGVETEEPSALQAVYGCTYDGESDCSSTDLPVVGSAPDGRARWQQLDMAGSMWEWVLDAHDTGWYASTEVSPCVDCANVADAGSRVIRGGAFDLGKDYLHTVCREGHLPNAPAKNVGFRCARKP